MTTWILLQCTGVAGGLDSDYTKSRTGFRFLGLIILARFLFENLVPYVFFGHRYDRAVQLYEDLRQSK